MPKATSTAAKKTTKKTTAAKTATRGRAMPIVPIPFDGPYEVYATGTDRLLARGTFKHGRRHGQWQGGTADGVHGWLETYVDGVRDGLTHEIIEGRGKHGLVAVGRSVGDKRVGPWTHYHDDGTTSTSNYDDPEPGPRNGLVTEAHRNGKVKSTCTYARGMRHGKEQRFFDDGKPEFEGEWLYGHPVGTHVDWDDEGVETRTTYVGGLPEAVAADRKALERTRKLYDKAKYVRSSDVGKGLETCAAAKDLHVSTDAWMLHMWRTLKVDISNDDAWGMFARVAPLVTGTDVIAMLRAIDFEDSYGWPIPKWHHDLDELVMSVYARDPDPIDAAWEKLKEPARSGVAYVRARHGKPVGTALAKQLNAVAENRQSPYRLWWPQDAAGPREIELDATEPPPELAQLRALFGTDTDWKKALVKALDKDDTSSDANTHRVWIETATAAELVEHARKLDRANWETIVTKWRHDDAAGLTTIALGLDAGSARDQIVALAILAHAAEHSTPPDALVDLLVLPADDLPTYGEQGDIRARAAVPRDADYTVFYRALATLPPTRILGLLERVLATTDYDRLRVGQYLELVDDLPFVERYLDLLVTDKSPRLYWVSGLGNPRFLPLLVERFDAQKKVKAKRLLSAAINIALAEDTFDPAFDAYIDFTLASERGFGRFLDRILCNLPRERAEAALLAGFDTAFFAAFTRISVCATEAVLRTAFGNLVTQKKPPIDDIETTIEGLPDGDNWWKWLHESGATGALRDECERQLRIGKYAD